MSSLITTLIFYPSANILTSHRFKKQVGTSVNVEFQGPGTHARAPMGLSSDLYKIHYIGHWFKGTG